MISEETRQKLIENAGRPKKEPTVTPGLRVEKELWDKFISKHKGKANQMFNDWIDSLLVKDISNV